MEGFLVIDKPTGLTSRDVVNIAQRWFPRGTKIGHTGTLDPLATGVLVLCVGAATKLADRVQAMAKCYESRVLVGATSDTDDINGTVVLHESPPVLLEAIEALLPKFVGEIQQMPPQFSALKVKGRRAHELARRGLVVPLEPRTVRIDALAILGYTWPHIDLVVDCGKGTYIRSIARDLGAALGVGGVVQTLRRTRVGPFRAEDGLQLPQDPGAAQAKLLPLHWAEK